TDKLQGDIKRRIAQLKDNLEHRSKKKGPSFRVKPEGAGQIMLIGPPNSGKSTLLAALTNAEPQIAEYPFTTREPMPGMVHYKDVQIQMVDLPPVSREYCESFVFDNIKVCDGALLVMDLGAGDPVEDFNETIYILKEKKITLVPPGSPMENSETGPPNIQSLLVFNKCDLDPDGELLSLIQEMMESPLPVRVVSAQNRVGLDGLATDMFNLLHVIRVYSKQPGKPPDLDAPFTTPIGTSVVDFAGRVHKDFTEQLKSARIWGSAKFDGQIVQRDYVLQDGDIVELSV
ncbi:MAG: GTPase, partial [bacterium]